MRNIHNIGLEQDIANVQDALAKVKESDRLHVIAEAMYGLRPDGYEYHSCGGAEWDITIDYRPVKER